MRSQPVRKKGEFYGRLGSIVIITWILIAFPFLFLPFEPAEGAATIVKIIIDDRSKIIDLEEDNTTTFRGNIEVITTSAKPVLVNLEAVFSNLQSGWQAEIRPQSMFFDVSDKQWFDVEVFVPVLTRADHYSFSVIGNWQFEGDDSWNKVSDVAYLTVAQYYSITIEPGPDMTPYFEREKNQELYYNFFIKNNGNGKDSFSLDLINIDDFITLDWDIRYSPSDIDLTAFSSIMVNVSLDPSENNVPFETEAQFELISDTTDTVVDILDLYIYSEKDRYVIVSGFKPLVVLRPLDLLAGALTNGESLTIQVEAFAYIKEAIVNLEFDIFSQRANERSNNFNFENGGFWQETKIETRVTPKQNLIKPGESRIFTVEIIGKNKTGSTLQFFELLRIKAGGKDVVSNVVNLEFVYITKGGNDDQFFVITPAVAIITVSTISVIAMMAGVIGGTEFGRYGFLLLFIPLYTKIHKEKVLDHFTRGRIYEYIRSHPGSHFSELKRELKLTNGGLAYHLYTLEREELIRSFRFGKLKMFYTKDFGIPKEPGRQFSELEATILQIIDENPGITQREVGEFILNRNHRTVSHNIKQLSREGYLRLEKEGRSNSCFIDFSSLGRSDHDKEADLKKSSITYRI